jgi:peptide/nickel transport system permease protein
MIQFGKRLLKHRTAAYGAGIVALVLLAAAGGPILSPYDANAQDLALLAKPPSWSHPLGTDLFGRDLLSRILQGARVSIGISLTAAAIATLVGVGVGVVAGLIGGWVDWILMRLVDVLLGFPRLFVVLLAVGFSAPSVTLTMLVLGLLSWMEVARIVRGEVLVIREMLYLKAAAALGLPRRRIVMKYVLPNLVSPIIVSTTLLVGTMILVEASLSFLGLGVQPPQASWGTILNQGRLDPVGAWWISTFAGLMVVLTVIGFNLLGDGLRDLLAPESRA